MIRKTGISFFLFFLLLISNNSSGQMPGWKFFLDGDGNSYFFDRNGKIFITTPVDKSIKHVSVKGLDFYISLIEDLLKAHRTVDALRLVKTILAMSPVDYRIVEAQQKVLPVKQKIIKNNGSRYEVLNRKASPLLYSDGEGFVTVMNENMHYSLRLKGMVAVIKNKVRSRPSYGYHGIMLGISFEKSQSNALFDCLMAIDAEKFAVTIRDVQWLEKSWDRRMLPFSGKKERILSGGKAFLYSLTGRSTGSPKTAFSGYEGYIVNGKYGYAFRIIAPAGRIAVLNEQMKALAFSIKVSGARH